MIFDKELTKYLKGIIYRKGITTSFEIFHKWYSTLDRKCHYCGINEQEIALLINNGLLTTKRLKTRGRSLELDRIEPEEAYDRLENITLCCYWCNNAKTDTFTYEEFLLIGQAIKTVWQQRLASITATNTSSRLPG